MASSENEVPPPLQDIPTAKEKKYDRQLRLWGAGGQIALENTHILLINNGSGVTGVETLKNLVLPGIGQFTILDSTTVSEADLGVNFFLEDSSLGKSRAQETVKYLQELNPDVRGHALTDPLETWLHNEQCFTPFTLILITAPIFPELLRTIESRVRELEIPAFYVHCIGYYSQFSLLLPPAFPIVDTHPDPTAITDLRLLRPWSALSAFAEQKTKDISTMNSEQFGHIPYVCLLLYYLERWKEKNDGSIPENYKEKTAFRDLVRSGSAEEENFDEACAAVLKSLNLPTPSSAVLEILTAPESQTPSADSPPFWIIANAVHQFYIAHGELPLPGAVPDMKAHSDTYIALQNIYRQKAREDCAEVVQAVRALEKALGRAPKLRVDEKEIENFCKGAAHVHLVRGMPRLPVADGLVPPVFGERAARTLARDLSNPESLLGVYFAFHAWDALRVQSPGAGGNEDFEAHVAELTRTAHAMIDAVVREAGLTSTDVDDAPARAHAAKACTELARAAGHELHNIASLTGGLVAQEVIKVITRQYVPVENTCVFDGVASRSAVLKV